MMSDRDTTKGNAEWELPPDVKVIEVVIGSVSGGSGGGGGRYVGAGGSSPAPLTTGPCGGGSGGPSHSASDDETEAERIWRITRDMSRG